MTVALPDVCIGINHNGLRISPIGFVVRHDHAHSRQSELVEFDTDTNHGLMYRKISKYSY